MPDLNQVNIAYIEEDPHDKNLFRLQILCNENGIYTKKDQAQAFPDQGFLRVVPDKKEKTSFKNRLRKMLPLCAVHLSGSDEDKSKLRPNRNYAPSENEHNQFVIYSDAISALPKDLIYEVITIPLNEKIPDALENIRFLTPKGYIQRGSSWYGPFITSPKKLHKKIERPSSQSLFSTLLFQDKQHLFYYPPLENLVDDVKETIPIGKALQIFDEGLDFDEQLASFSHSLGQSANLLKEPNKNLSASAVPLKAAVPGSGTPLYARISSKREAVKGESFNQVVINKLSSPAPSSPVPIPNKGSSVPLLDALAKDSAQLLTHLKDLSALPSFKNTVKKLLAQSPLSQWEDFSHKALSYQLESLEAERLSLVLQLEKAKENLEQFTKDAINKNQKTQEEALDTLKLEIKKLSAEKEALLAFENDFLQKVKEDLGKKFLPYLSNSPTALHQLPGESYPFSHILHHVHFYLQNVGYLISKNQTATLLLAMAQSQKVTLVHPDLSFSRAFFQDFLKALSLEKCLITRNNPNIPLLLTPPVEKGSPFFILYPKMILEQTEEYVFSIYFSTGSPDESAQVLTHVEPWPLFFLDFTVDYQQQLVNHSPSNLLPLSLNTWRSWVKGETVFSDQLQALLKQISAFAFDSPFPFGYIQKIVSFVSATANQLSLGVAGALDMGLCLFFIPFVLAQKKGPHQEILLFLKGFPSAKNLYSHFTANAK